MQNLSPRPDRFHFRPSPVSEPDDKCDTPPRKLSYNASSSLTQSLAGRSVDPKAPFTGSDRPSVKEALGQQVRNFKASAQGAQFGKEFNQLYELILGDNGRGIRDMLLKEGVEDPLSAVYQLGAANRVALLTGFKVPVPNGSRANPENPRDFHGIQETDGPLGVAVLALACLRTKKPVSVICDRETQLLVEACLRELDGQRAVDAVQFLTYEALGPEEATAAANGIAATLMESGTDLLIPIETAGRTVEGVARSMAGIDISGYNPDYDTLICTLSPQMKVIAIGDGGNEAGFGGTVTGVPPAANGKEMQAVTGAHYSVRARVSNWGALILAFGLARLAAVPKHEMPTVEQHNAAIRAMLRAGAVDGCTKNTDEGFDNGKYRTGVDGMTVEVNGELYQRCVNTFSETPIEFPLGRFPEWDEPLTVMFLDSSDGVFIAAEKMIPYLEAQLGRKVIQFVLYADHGNAPYGPKTLDQIEQCVAEALGNLSEISDAEVVTACNTACTGILGLERRGVKVSAINLVVNSSNVIVNDPYQRVALLSTGAMAGSGLFQTLIQHGLTTRGVEKQFGVFGCPGWAEIVNERALSSDDPETRTRALAVIKTALASLPTDLDAIYLCCTHFPALTNVIREIYTDIRESVGIRVPFVIVDPIKKQAETAVRHLSKGGFNERPIRSDQPIVVLTTGDVDKVRTSAQILLGRTDIDVRSTATISARVIDRQINELHAAARDHQAGDDPSNLVLKTTALLERIAKQPELMKLSSLDFLVDRLSLFADPEESEVSDDTREVVRTIVTSQILPMVAELNFPAGASARHGQWKTELLDQIERNFVAEAVESAELELAG
jgi:glutamate racemase